MLSDLHFSIASTGKLKLIAWTPLLIRATTSRATAPLSRLGPQELSNLAQWLDFRDLTMLYATGCKALWTAMASSVTEARYTPFADRFAIVLPINPFPALSKLTMLHTIILRRVWYLPTREECDGKSPFLCLPPTLQHFEYEETWTFPTLRVPADEAKDMTWYMDMDFGKAFPRLKRLRLFLRIRDVGVRPDPRWVKTLPPTLQALSLCNLGYEQEILFYICGSEIALDAPDLNIASFARRPPAPLPSNPVDLKLPLPSLVLLHILSADSSMKLDLDKLPSTVKDFQWREIHGVKHGGPTNLALLPDDPHLFSRMDTGLTSLSLFHPRDAFLMSGNATDFPLLTHLEAPLPIHGPQRLPYSDHLESLNITLDADPTLFGLLMSELNTAGTLLKKLILRGTAVPDPNNAIHKTVLSSLTHLEFPCLQATDFVLLPPTLRTLKVAFWQDHEEVLSDVLLQQLPSGLTKLEWPTLCVELGHVPLLPRRLLHLSFRPINRAKIGNTFITPEILEEPTSRGLAHLYESITSETRVLYGLPPKLEVLNLQAMLFVFDSNFGLFLPRTLRVIHGDGLNNWCIDIAAGPSKPTGIDRISSWLGASKKSDDRLAKAINGFPPLCLSSLYFINSAGIGTPKRIEFEAMKPFCKSVTPLERIPTS